MEGVLEHAAQVVLAAWACESSGRMYSILNVSCLHSQIKGDRLRESLSSPEGVAMARLGLELMRIRVDACGFDYPKSVMDSMILDPGYMLEAVKESWAKHEMTSHVSRLQMLAEHADVYR